jgi:hypothetical protein
MESMKANDVCYWLDAVGESSGHPNASYKNKIKLDEEARVGRASNQEKGEEPGIPTSTWLAAGVAQGREGRSHPFSPSSCILSSQQPP